MTERRKKRGIEHFPPHILAESFCRQIDEVLGRQTDSPTQIENDRFDLRIRFELGLILFLNHNGATFTEKLFAEYKKAQETPTNVHQLFPTPPPIDEMLRGLEPDFQELAKRLLPLSPSFYKLGIFHP